MAVTNSKKNKEIPEQPDTGRQEWERRIRMQVIGFLLLPFSVFPVLSLLTYNWRDISWLNSPPLSPASNWIGPVGAWSVFVGYSFIGLALWTVPVFVFLFGILMITGKMVYAFRKFLWVLLFVMALSCLLQLGSDGALKDVLDSKNIGPNAGGMVGYCFMTCALTRWINPLGSGLLVLSVMIFAMFMIIGPRALVSALIWCSSRIFHGVEDDGTSGEKTAAGGAMANPAGGRAAAVAAREAARTARIEERERERQLKKEAAEAKRLQQEESVLARKNEKDRLRLESRRQQQDLEIERIRLQADLARKAAAEAQRLAHAAPVVRDGDERAARPSLRGAALSGHDGAGSAALPVKKAEISATRKETKPENKPPKKEINYMLPPVDLLDPLPTDRADHGSVEDVACELITVLNHFKIPAQVIGIKPGPVVTQYEIEPAPHIRVERIAGLSNNLKMSLAAASLRVEAPIPGKKAVGIEIPNKKARSVTFRSIVESSEWQDNTMIIPLAVGKNVTGDNFIYDLTRAPHMLVAGSTGSGKSVCLNAFLCGMLMSRTPEQLKLILIDPKRVEFVSYNDLPHLLVPVINDPNRVVFGLKWAVSEMDKRYRLLQKAGAKNIEEFNNRTALKQSDLFEAMDEEQDAEPDKLPYIVIVIDEVADIMNAAGKEVEPIINRLCALSRAVGIHMILATQRPSVDVITGTIKANIPGRIAFKVSQSNDSRTILDSPGAENLIGMGDMLFLQAGADLLRVQGAWVSPMEVNRIVSYVKERHAPVYDEKLSNRLEKIKETNPDDIMNEDDADDEDESKSVLQQEKRESELEDLYRDAVEMIRVHKRISGELLRRKLKVGYSRANTIMDMLEERGIVSSISTTNTRDILMDLQQPVPGKGLPHDEAGDDPDFDDENSASDAFENEER